jgi:hypothetical protein
MGRYNHTGITVIWTQDWLTVSRRIDRREEQRTQEEQKGEQVEPRKADSIIVVFSVSSCPFTPTLSSLKYYSAQRSNPMHALLPIDPHITAAGMSRSLGAVRTIFCSCHALSSCRTRYSGRAIFSCCISISDDPLPPLEEKLLVPKHAHAGNVASAPRHPPMWPRRRAAQTTESRPAEKHPPRCE